MIPDEAKVPAVGASGTIVSYSLADVSLILSIFVSVATLIWVGLKCYYLIKHKGKSGPE